MATVLKIQVSNENVHFRIAPEVQLLFIRGICNDSACHSFPSMGNGGSAEDVALR
jgi:hypothetical protein